jgi:hypothetical protein
MKTYTNNILKCRGRHLSSKLIVYLYAQPFTNPDRLYLQIIKIKVVISIVFLFVHKGYFLY